MYARTRWLPMSAMNAYRSRLSAKYWNRLPLATPARRAMTFRLPRENPCAPNSASAASMIAARRAGSTRAHVTVGMQPPSVMTTGHSTVSDVTVKGREGSGRITGASRTRR